jgi:hypothetical protein
MAGHYKASDQQNRVTPPKYLEVKGDITAMKAMQHRITGKAVLPENYKVCTTTAFVE